MTGLDDKAADAAEVETMTMESVLLRIRSCAHGGCHGVQGLLDVFLSSYGSDQQVADAVVESLVDRMRYPV